HHDPLTYTKYTIAQKKKHYRALRRQFIPHLSKWGYSRQLWINLFALADNLDTPIQDMSHGMREKTIIIRTLLVNPEVWILDEPIQGLDPQAAFDLKQVMKAHAEQGKTVIFSTHVLDTAQQLCGEIAILKNGEMIFNGSVKSLLEAHPKESLETIYLNLIGRKNNQSEIEQLEGDSHAE
ncbi:ATP-binding cassette domain-containing protein, partial [Lactobacillus sanfranciscensis]|uniref:ATP-binding cassette domain-containing protein n=1 Tax=Fructilactobacillus sanfranciscensis TaxID=1625 RepID=UPI0013D24015